MSGLAVETIAPEIHPALMHARGLLERALGSLREEIHAAATRFTRLAAEVNGVLELTAGIVGCVEGDCAESVAPTVERLGAAARQFLEERIGSVSQVAGVFANEAAMLERLDVLTTSQRAIAREARSLSVLAAVEVARLGDLGLGFEYMARELDQFSSAVMAGTDGVRKQIERRRAGEEERCRDLKASLERMRRRFDAIEADLGEAIGVVDKTVSELTRIPAQFRDCLQGTGDRIGRVVAAVQTEDFTRQQTEHVRDALGQMARNGSSAEAAPEQRKRQAAILKVQEMQLESVRAQTAEWITQMEECIQDISRIGLSDVAAIGSRILEQEKGLSGQMQRIEELERQSDADDEELTACLAGLHNLLAMARDHLNRSLEARDRMQLLNFNSMIEARRLGDRATVVLEIARNISRVSSGWGELTERSGEAMESMLDTAGRAEESHRESSRTRKENLEAAWRESRASLAALNHAADVAGRNGTEVDAAVARLQREIAGLGQIAGRLRGAVDLLNDGLREIESTGQSLRPVEELSEAEKQDVESECAAEYTCELERQILRAALYGEAAPVASSMAAGNEVELF